MRCVKCGHNLSGLTCRSCQFKLNTDELCFFGSARSSYIMSLGENIKKELNKGHEPNEPVDPADPTPLKTGLLRLRRALDIIEANYFDGVSISKKDQAFIDKMGGKEALMRRMFFEISETYDKFWLMKIYFQDRNRLTKRQQAAIRYWAEKCGMSIEDYMKSEQSRYHIQFCDAVSIVRRELLDTGKYEYDELLLDDAAVVYDFDDKGLIRVAKQQMYMAKRDEILPYLAGCCVHNKTGYMPDREAEFAIEYLMQQTGLTREQLERRMAAYAQEIYLPSPTQERESKSFVESRAERVTDSDLESCVDALGTPSCKDITAMLRMLEIVVKRNLELNRKGVTVRIEADSGVIGSSGEYGSYSPDTKTATVYAGYIIERERNVSGQYNALFRCCDTMAHVLFHAYQDAYKKKYDDKRSQMYAINDSDYVQGNRPDETHADYRRQLVELEAWHYGGIISNRIKTVFGRKRGFAEIDKIKKYLVEQAGKDEEIAAYNCERLAKHEDIVKEYSNWIDSRDFTCENPVTVEEWTAQKLHDRFPHVDDLTIFMTLSDLRDFPSAGHRRINSFFATM